MEEEPDIRFEARCWVDLQRFKNLVRAGVSPWEAWQSALVRDRDSKPKFTFERKEKP